MSPDQDQGLVDWTALEEQRRTFWMAYSLDRFISFHSSLPFTLNEQLVDPMLIFARIVAQTLVLFLHNVLESITWKTGDHLLGIIEYERLCILAAHEVLSLLKLQAQLGYFKTLAIFPEL
ncbi:hypothetical protein ATERTT37_000466 [Aspergillus terreus]